MPRDYIVIDDPMKTRPIEDLQDWWNGALARRALARKAGTGRCAPVVVMARISAEFLAGAEAGDDTEDEA